MEEILKEALKSGEKLLWSGRPESFETLDATHKKDFVVSLVCSAVIAAVLLALYVYFALKNNVEIKAFVVIVVLILSFFKPLGVWTDASRLKKSVMYAATDKRLIVIREGTKEASYGRIQEAQFKTDADGHTSLLCGKNALKLKDVKWRGATIVGQNTDDGEAPCDSFVMYAVPESEKLKAVLAEKLSEKITV